MIARRSSRSVDSQPTSRVSVVARPEDCLGYAIQSAVLRSLAAIATGRRRPSAAAVSGYITTTSYGPLVAVRSTVHPSGIASKMAMAASSASSTAIRCPGLILIFATVGLTETVVLREGRPDRSLSIAFSSRRARVAGRFASVNALMCSRRLVYDRASNTVRAWTSPASAVARSAGTTSAGRTWG